MKNLTSRRRCDYIVHFLERRFGSMAAMASRWLRRKVSQRLPDSGPFHPAGNGSFGNIKTQHEQFSVDARRTPRWILGDHAEDQIPVCTPSGLHLHMKR
jgi:hypothetical protein